MIELLSLLDKFIDREERYLQDAVIRQDSEDKNLFKHGKDVVEELKNMVENFK